MCRGGTRAIPTHYFADVVKWLRHFGDIEGIVCSNHTVRTILHVVGVDISSRCVDKRRKNGHVKSGGSYDKAPSQFIQHISRFIQWHRHKEWTVTDERCEWFLTFQSHGPKRLTEHQLQQIEPFIEAQKWKEVTVKMFVEELCEWWSKGWGWIYPMLHTIETEDDPVMLKAILKIKTNIEQNGFRDFMYRYPDIDHERKLSYDAQHIACIDEQIQIAKQLGKPV